MILTVTPNPALDYTLRVDAFEVGRRARYRDARLEPAGKGINVSRMIRRLGEPTLALGFSAGATGGILGQELDREGVPHELIPVPGLTRINVTLLTGPEGSATHLHGPGDPVGAAQVRGLLDQVAKHLSGAGMLVISGSLPPGMTPQEIADIVRLARQAGVRSMVDAEGELLGAALGARVDLVKPNVLEAGEFLGRSLGGVPDAAEAALELLRRGAQTAVITLRGDGAVGAELGRVWQALPPREPVVRAVGAGDSFAAGLAVGLTQGKSFPEALRLAAAAGAATAIHSGTGLGTPEEVRGLLARTVLREIG